jgi:hypothetical protein
VNIQKLKPKSKAKGPENKGGAHEARELSFPGALQPFIAKLFSYAFFFGGVVVRGARVRYFL